MSRPRVLLVAHHANPEWGSEPLIGWRWARSLSEHVDLTLVTHVRNRPALERRAPLPFEVRHVDTERLARRVQDWNDRLWGKGSPVNRLLLEALAQRAFDREAVRIARSLVRAGRVDLIHRVSPISPRFPTGLGRVGVPLVLGPQNGGMTTAPAFQDVRRLERDGFLRLRGLARLLDPLARSPRSATRLLVATRATLDVLPAADRARAELLCENGVALEEYSPHFERRGRGLRVLYLGRLLPYKGVDSVLRALARVADPAVVLDVVGEGPDRARLEALAAELGLLQRVVFHGAVPVDEVPVRMAACDVYAFPSVRESGGATVLEAMASGKPVLVADHGGPSETVVDGVGWRLPVESREGLVDGLAHHLERLRDDEELRQRTGRAAREHVERNYSWSAKAARMAALYQECLAPGPRTRQAG